MTTMMTSPVKEFASDLVRSFKEFVRSATSPIETRLHDIEGRLEELRREVASANRPGKDGQPGKDGESIHPDTVRAMLHDAMDEAIPRVVALIPKPEDG